MTDLHEYAVEVVEVTTYTTFVRARNAKEARADVQARTTVWPSGLIRRSIKPARLVSK